jgi:hypothetical protein
VDCYNEIIYLPLREKNLGLEVGIFLVFFIKALVIEKLGVYVSSFFLNNKKTFLPLKSTKFKIIDQGLS